MTMDHRVACIRAGCLLVLLGIPIVAMVMLTAGVTAVMRIYFLAGICFALTCGLSVWLVYLDWTGQTKGRS